MRRSLEYALAHRSVQSLQHGLPHIRRALEVHRVGGQSYAQQCAVGMARHTILVGRHLVVAQALQADSDIVVSVFPYPSKEMRYMDVLITSSLQYETP